MAQTVLTCIYLHDPSRLNGEVSPILDAFCRATAAFTHAVHSIILRADIYEEEDYVANLFEFEFGNQQTGTQHVVYASVFHASVLVRQDGNEATGNLIFFLPSSSSPSETSKKALAKSFKGAEGALVGFKAGKLPESNEFAPYADALLCRLKFRVHLHDALAAMERTDQDGLPTARNHLEKYCEGLIISDFMDNFALRMFSIFALLALLQGQRGARESKADAFFRK